MASGYSGRGNTDESDLTSGKSTRHMSGARGGHSSNMHSEFSEEEEEKEEENITVTPMNVIM